jgi:hypothetical protein
MKLDNEEQRESLLGLLASVEFTVTAPTIQQTGAMIFGLLDKVRQAGLEKQVVPIESLAPDPPDLKVESG